jgi:hypothetical protein
MKLPELRHALANCPKAKSFSVHDQCKVTYGEDRFLPELQAAVGKHGGLSFQSQTELTCFELLRLHVSEIAIAPRRRGTRRGAKVRAQDYCLNFLRTTAVSPPSAWWAMGHTASRLGNAIIYSAAQHKKGRRRCSSRPGRAEPSPVIRIAVSPPHTRRSTCPVSLPARSMSAANRGRRKERRFFRHAR